MFKNASELTAGDKIDLNCPAMPLSFAWTVLETRPGIGGRTHVRVQKGRTTSWTTVPASVEFYASV